MSLTSDRDRCVLSDLPPEMCGCANHRNSAGFSDPADNHDPHSDKWTRGEILSPWQIATPRPEQIAPSGDEDDDHAGHGVALRHVEESEIVA